MADRSRWRSSYGPVHALCDFDARFYASQHPDLAGMGRLALLKHYVLRGRTEGRCGSLKEAIARAEGEHGPLPAGFDAHIYRRANPDLAAAFPRDLDLVVHFLEYGRGEGRRYSRFDAAFYRALYRDDWPLDPPRLEQDWLNHQSEARYGSWWEMLAAYGFTYGPWVELIQPVEFTALNQSWAGEVRTRPQAALAFVREGCRRLAPLALGMEFDAEFYREIRPELADEQDGDLYKAWLLDGVANAEPPSPRAYLRQLGLSSSRYPEAFAWTVFRDVYPGDGSDRWSVLKRLVEDGFPRDGIGEIGDDQLAFLEHLSEAYARRGDDASAIFTLKTLQQRGLSTIAMRQRLGDAYLRLRLWDLALAEYGQVMAAGGANLWTVVNAATCALHLGDHERAFAVLADGRNRFEGEQAWLRKLEEAIEADFLSASFQARQFYAQDRVEAGHQQMYAVVGRTVARFTDVAPLGAPVPPHPDGRVVILANQDLRQCAHYRVEQKAELFEALGRPCKIFAPSDIAGFLTALPGASAAIFYRLVAIPDVIKAILTARTLGVPTYYEIDDLVFDAAVYPPPIETYGGQVSRPVYDGLRYGTPLTNAAMSLCDYGIASTKALAAKMAPVVRTKQCFTIRNGLDSRNASYLETPPHRSQDDRITIFYGSGTLAHNTDFLELAGPALLELLGEDDRIGLVIVGYLVLDDAFAPFLDRIERVAFLPDAKAYWALLAKADINLAVLEPGIISDCKSEIKWLEAAVFAVPSIVSSTATYRDMLEDGRDVLMAADRDGWRTALRRLVDAAALREQIGVEARRKAASLYGLEAGAESLRRALAPADEGAGQGWRGAKKPRVLIVNVYFPPQTIGGATRVVRDNIDSWIASGVADEFDLAVVCTDHEAKPAYESRMDAYRGLPVFRISTPIQVNMDWRPLDRKAAAVFSAFLDAWRPDLVHFHATQRLTASCLEACRQAGVPYLVTVHDGWWISDWQFLTDDDGCLRPPGTPLLEPTRSGVTPAQSQRRLNRLCADLERAEAVLAVSDSFADLYRSVGVRNVVSVPNGIPHLKRRPRLRSSTGRVRLGHIGSMTVHKGFHLVYAALNQGEFKNLELTVVDHNSRDDPEHQIWGATPVEIVGKSPQGAIEDLYARLDVLLAPSIWPESFGLVVREALSCGLWVVASDRGAMGEDVQAGENGFVIDVSDASALKAVLAKIDADPQRYLESPLFTKPLRTADQQADELADLYRRIIDTPAKQPKAAVSAEQPVPRPA